MSPYPSSPYPLLLVGCGNPNRSMGWFHARNVLSKSNSNSPNIKGINTSRLAGIIEPFLKNNPTPEFTEFINQSGIGNHRVFGSVEEYMGAVNKTNTGSDSDPGSDNSENVVPPPSSVLALIALRTCDVPPIFKSLLDVGVKKIYLEKPGASSVAELRVMREQALVAKGGACDVCVGYARNVHDAVKNGKREVERLQSRSSNSITTDKIGTDSNTGRGLSSALTDTPDTQVSSGLTNDTMSSDESEGDLSGKNSNIDAGGHKLCTNSTNTSDLRVVNNNNLDNIVTLESESNSNSFSNNITVTFIHNNTYTDDQIEECFTRNSEGMLKNMAFHEIALALTFFGLTPELCRGEGNTEVHNIGKDSIMQTHGKYTDFVRMLFSIKSDSGINLQFKIDRQGGDWAGVEVTSAESQKSKLFTIPTNYDDYQLKLKQNPDIVPYLLMQEECYSEMLSTFAMTAIDSKDRGPLVSLDQAMDVLECCEILTEKFKKVMA